MLAHKAEEEAIKCIEFIKYGAGHVNYDLIPGVIYTHPELASVGKTEEELKAAKISYKKGIFPFIANSRARCQNDFAGFAKILTCATTNKILGGHILGHEAGELIHEIAIGMNLGATSEQLARSCHAHPCFSEAVKEACLGAHSKTINY